MKQSDIEAIEKVLFQYYDDKFDDGFLYLTEDDISDIEQIFESDNWGEPDSMEQDFSIEEILDMPTEGDVNNGNNEQNTDNKSHGEDNHGIFCVTGNDSGLVDIDDLY